MCRGGCGTASSISPFLKWRTYSRGVCVWKKAIARGCLTKAYRTSQGWQKGFQWQSYNFRHCSLTTELSNALIPFTHETFQLKTAHVSTWKPFSFSVFLSRFSDFKLGCCAEWKKGAHVADLISLKVAWKDSPDSIHREHIFKSISVHIVCITTGLDD